VLLSVLQCGRPNQEDNCRACGARIGGMNHNLVANNVLMNKLVLVVVFVFAVLIFLVKLVSGGMGFIVLKFLCLFLPRFERQAYSQ